MTKLPALFVLLAPILTALVSVVLVLSTSTLAAGTGGIFRYGYCYSNKDCTSNDAITVQGPDSTKSVDLLNGYYKYCASFRADPSRAVNLYLCEAGCNTNCIRINSGCGKPDNVPRFTCAFRTERYEDED